MGFDVQLLATPATPTGEAARRQIALVLEAMGVRRAEAGCGATLDDGQEIELHDADGVAGARVCMDLMNEPCSALIYALADRTACFIAPRGPERLFRTPHVAAPPPGRRAQVEPVGNSGELHDGLTAAFDRWMRERDAPAPPPRPGLLARLLRRLGLAR